MTIRPVLVLIAIGLLAGPAMSVPAGMSDGVLVDSKGMTLYIFDKDAPGESNCYGGCAQSWPPFAASGAAAPDGDFTIVTRKGGDTQWAYKGQPLYYWIGDSKPGQTNGDGVGGVWHVVK